MGSKMFGVILKGLTLVAVSISMYACMYVYHQATVVFILGLPFLCKEHSRKEEADYKVGPTLSTHGGDVGNISRAQAEERRQS